MSKVFVLGAGALGLGLPLLSWWMISSKTPSDMIAIGIVLLLSLGTLALLVLTTLKSRKERANVVRVYDDRHCQERRRRLMQDVEWNCLDNWFHHLTDDTVCETLRIIWSMDDPQVMGYIISPKAYALLQQASLRKLDDELVQEKGLRCETDLVEVTKERDSYHRIVDWYTQTGRVTREELREALGVVPGALPPD